ncbi:MAG: 30S ribosomal protein S2 [Candidatus Levybacteria bacterium]|nr:30S ribosomal protein S2 [Candidatus Levybacteria bacterium]
MRQVTLEQLLSAGCHFGHQITRQNPKARDFIFESRDNIHIIDLAKTKVGLEEAAAFIRELGTIAGSSMIVIGTKRQAQAPVVAQVKRAEDEGASEGLFSVTNRWIGGLLTNFQEVSKNFEKLSDLSSKLVSDEEKSKYTKKEVGDWAKEKQKLENFYGGVANMKKTPDALFIIDTHLENLAVREARAMGIATVGIVDTNADPEVIDYVIPANDDAVGSVELLVSYIMDAWIEGRKDLKNKTQKEEAKVASDKKKEEKTKEKPATTENTEKKKKPIKTAVKRGSK